METITLTMREYQQLTRKKQSDSIWSKTKKELRKLVEEEFDLDYPCGYYKVTEGVSMIARPMLEKRVSRNFTESDNEAILQVFKGIIKEIKAFQVEKNI